MTSDEIIFKSYEQWQECIFPTYTKRSRYEYAEAMPKDMIAQALADINMNNLLEELNSSDTLENDSPEE